MHLLFALSHSFYSEDAYFTYTSAMIAGLVQILFFQGLVEMGMHGILGAIAIPWIFHLNNR
jgi:hypothetical protein